MGAAPERESNIEELSEDRLLTRFDELVESGLVVYNKNSRTVRLMDQCFAVRTSQASRNAVLNHVSHILQFEFRILSSLTTKPPAHSAAPPNCRPGSDINVTGYEMAALGPPDHEATHLLAANKFPAARPHFLILTQDGWRRQHEALDAEDFAAARQALDSLTRRPSLSSSCRRRRYLLFFNCGFDSGCSRVHKHMQVVPVDGDTETDFPMWPDAEDPRTPFKFSMERFRSGLPPVDELVKVYHRLLEEAERAVGWERGREGRHQDEALPHNLVLDERWMVVVPRRAPGWDGADTNAMGMLGMVWVHDEERMQRWVDKGPAEVLRRLGYPAE
ncbi:hypothetical protein VTJ49DRAFT_5739 [Mycothermus thermophilus]|uniref:Uncharacterized protein n=1 Tax=Humicola insolens TaxID=85995 RepID=A0ABR3V315_HUMIN